MVGRVPASVAKLLLTTLAVVQAWLGAGAGERVVYFGTHAAHGASCRHAEPVNAPSCAHDHGADSACAHSRAAGADLDHGRGLPLVDGARGEVCGLGAWLRYLPLAIPVDVRHHHDSNEGCAHAHVRGHDATAASGPHPAPRPAVAALPSFLATLAAARPLAVFGDDLAALRAPARPPDPPLDGGVRLLI
jgi:hypothetical protein